MEEKVAKLYNDSILKINLKQIYVPQGRHLEKYTKLSKDLTSKVVVWIERTRQRARDQLKREPGEKLDHCSKTGWGRWNMAQVLGILTLPFLTYWSSPLFPFTDA